MRYALTERRVSSGVLPITVLCAGLWGCIADDELATSARQGSLERGQSSGALVIPIDSAYQEPANLAELAPLVHLAQDAPADINGNELTFHAAWDNSGTTAARSGVLTLSIPAATTLVSASAGGHRVGGVVTWNLGNLLPSMSGEVSITVRASAPGSYTSAGELAYRVGRTPQVERSSQTVHLGGQDDPPETAIASGPASPTEETSASFAFTSDDAFASFECSLDGAAFTACASPLLLDGVSVGEHALAVRAVDAAGQVDATPAEYAWTVLPPNQLPVANDDEASVLEDGEVSIAVRANDGGGDAPVILAEVSAPLHGSATIVNDEVRYAPAADFHGSDSFTYTLRDGNGDTSTATVTVSVTSANDTPTAVLDTFTMLEDGGTIVLDLLANDTGLGDGPISFVSLGAPMNGVLVLEGGQVRYTPKANFNGSDVVLYTIRDADGQQSSSVAFLTVRPVNDAPLARDDAFTVAAGQVSELDLLRNDADPDGNGLTLVSVTAPDLGSVAVANNKAWFTAPAGASGTTTFTYLLSDGQGGLATGTVTVVIE